MRHQFELPDHIYEIAQDAAAREGMTPEEWIAATVSRAGIRTPVDATPVRDRVVSEVLTGAVGAFDSSQEDYGGRQVSPLAEMVADKLERQGIDSPWRRRR